MAFLLAAILLAQDEADLKRVRDVLARAEESAAAISEPYLKSKAWGEVAEMQAAIGDDAAALKLVEKIPNAYEKSLAYASVAKALSKAGHGEAARRTALLGLKASGEGEQDFKTGNAVGHLVVALAEAGDLDGAVRRLEAIPGGPTGLDFAVKDVAFVLAKRGKVNRALQLLAKAEDWTLVRGIEGILKDCDPAAAVPIVKKIGEPSLRGRALGAIAMEQLARGTADDAVATAKSIEDLKEKCETFVRLADALRARSPDQADGLLAAARGWVEAIEDPASRCDAAAALARAWGKALKAETAARFAALAEKARADIPNDYRRTWALTKVAAATAAGGNLSRALELAASDPKGARDEVLMEIARSQVEVGDFKGALKTVEPCKSRYPASVILVEIAGRDRDPVEVRKRLAEAAAAMAQIDTKSKTLNDFRNGNPLHEHLWKLMEAQSKAGDFESAAAMAQRLRSDLGHWFGGFAIRRAAEWQAEAGKLDDALAWVGKVDEALPKSLGLTGAAEGALKRAKR